MLPIEVSYTNSLKIIIRLKISEIFQHEENILIFSVETCRRSRSNVTFFCVVSSETGRGFQHLKSCYTLFVPVKTC